MRQSHRLIVVSALAWLSTSCATVSVPPRPPSWPDTDSTRESIRCAVKAIHGEAFAIVADTYRLEVDDDLPLLETIVATHPPTIIVNARARTALSSAFRHAVFWHIVPHLLPGADWNMFHRPEWDAQAIELDRQASLCRAAFHETLNPPEIAQ